MNTITADIKRVQVETAAHGRVEWDVVVDGARMTFKTRWAAKVYQAALAEGIDEAIQSLRDLLDDQQIINKREAAMMMRHLRTLAA